MRFIPVFLALLLTACASTEVVVLKHTGTGQTVQCGPYQYNNYSAGAAALREIQCIQDYQRQGYERL